MSIVSRYQKLYSGVVYDALAFDLHYNHAFVVAKEIKPLWTMTKPLVGPAFTSKGAVLSRQNSMDDTKRIKMLDDMQPGCIQVLDTGDDEECAHYGDITAQLAMARGAVGAVVDGYTRDTDRIKNHGFPFLSRGSLPVDAFGHWQITDWCCRITVRGHNGRVEIESNDWIFADNDGVLVIAAEDVETVCVMAEQRAKNEENIRRRLQPGNEMALYQEVGRW